MTDLTNTDTADQSFRIPAENFGYFEARMTKLMRRAKKLAVEGRLGYEVTDTEVVADRIVDELGIVRTLNKVVHVVRVWAPVVKLNGWAFTGRFDFRTAPGATLRMMAPGETCPAELYDADATRCDHCGHRRRRNDSFIVRHDDGKQLVVGRTCLADFLGHVDAKSIARLAELPALACFEASESEGGGRRVDIWAPTEVLALSFASIRQHGWAPAREERSTRDDVLDLLTPCREPRAEQERQAALAKVADRDWERASEAVAWIVGLDTLHSDYLNNLKAVLTTGVISRGMGIAVSGATAYDRAMGREAERKREAAAPTGPSGHVGTKGDRLDFEAETTFVRYTDGYYGTTTIIKLRDDAGNVYTWFASGSKDVERGQRFTVRGTVKKHDEFRGEKQTVLTRCTLKKAA